MKLRWLGHSCFLMVSDMGTSVVTDPYDPYIGFSLPQVEADIVTTSHKHGDHYNVKGIKGKFKHIEEPGTYDISGVHIVGTSTFHDSEGGTKRGSNVVFVFEIDGLRICHCGDLGHLPTEKQVESIGRVDVLLVPAGSVYTVDGAGAAEVARLLEPSVTIPMHYKTPALNFGLDGVDKFLAAIGGGKRLDSQEVELTRENLAEQPRVLVLKPVD